MPCKDTCLVNPLPPLRIHLELARPLPRRIISTHALFHRLIFCTRFYTTQGAEIPPPKWLLSLNYSVTISFARKFPHRFPGFFWGVHENYSKNLLRKQFPQCSGWVFLHRRCAKHTSFWHIGTQPRLFIHGMCAETMRKLGFSEHRFLGLRRSRGQKWGW